MNAERFTYVSVKGIKNTYKEDKESSHIEPVTEVTVVLGDVSPSKLARLHALSRDGNLQVSFAPVQSSFDDIDKDNSKGSVHRSDGFVGSDSDQQRGQMSEVINETVDRVNSGALDTEEMKVTASRSE